MKKLSLLTLLAGLTLPFGLVSAQNLGKYGNSIYLGDILASIETTTWVIFSCIVVVCFVISGIAFLTAQGAPEKLKLAKAAVLWGGAGVVVGIIAYSIEVIIGSALGV